MRNARRRARRLVDNGWAGRLLDVGAGNGAFVEAATNVGFDASGIELSQGAARVARAAGREVFAGKFPDEAPQGPFDVITLWDVLAGLTDPRQALKGVHSRLGAQRHLVLTVPLVTSPIARLLGRFWPLWIPPVNLHYFSHESIRVLLRATGFELISCSTEAKDVAVDFLVRKGLRAAGLKGLSEWAGHWVPAQSVSVNLGDILTVQARKLAR